jgi:hypothetical protein
MQQNPNIKNESPGISQGKIKFDMKTAKRP